MRKTGSSKTKTANPVTSTAQAELNESRSTFKCLDSLIKQVDPYLADVIRKMWLTQEYPGMSFGPWILWFTQRLTGKKDGSLARIRLAPQIPSDEVITQIVNLAKIRGLLLPDQEPPVMVYYDASDEYEPLLSRLQTAESEDIPHMDSAHSSKSSSKKGKNRKKGGQKTGGSRDGKEPVGSNVAMDGQLDDQIEMKLLRRMADIYEGTPWVSTSPRDRAYSIEL